MLGEAAREGNVEKVKALLERDPPEVNVNSAEYSPLRIGNGSVSSTVNELQVSFATLPTNVSCHMRTPDSGPCFVQGMTPLYLAAINGKIGVIRALLNVE